METNLDRLQRMHKAGVRFIYEQIMSGETVIPWSQIFEGKVEEFSPSNLYVKINNAWYSIEKLTILEELVG